MPSFLDLDTGTFFRGSQHTIATVAAATVYLWDGMNAIGPQVTGVGTLASLTALLPPSPVAGEVVTIVPTVSVTALTLKDAVGNAVSGVTSLTENTSVRLMWNGANSGNPNTWTKLS
jgi:hypothetical protein